MKYRPHSVGMCERVNFTLNAIWLRWQGDDPFALPNDLTLYFSGDRGRRETGEARFGTVEIISLVIFVILRLRD